MSGGRREIAPQPPHHQTCRSASSGSPGVRKAQILVQIAFEAHALQRCNSKALVHHRGFGVTPWPTMIAHSVSPTALPPPHITESWLVSRSEIRMPLARPR